MCSHVFPETGGARTGWFSFGTTGVTWLLANRRARYRLKRAFFGAISRSSQGVAISESLRLVESLSVPGSSWPVILFPLPGRHPMVRDDQSRTIIIYKSKSSLRSPFHGHDQESFSISHDRSALLEGSGQCDIPQGWDEISAPASGPTTTGHSTVPPNVTPGFTREC